MSFNRDTTLALASLGAAVGAIFSNGPKSRRQFFSRERTIGSLLGASAGLAVGLLGEVAQPATSLQGLPLLDNDPTPLKRRRIELVRADAPLLPLPVADVPVNRQTIVLPQILNNPLLG